MNGKYISSKRDSSYWEIHQFYKPYLKVLDNEYVLFDAVTGDTSRVPQLEGFIIERLLDRSLQIPELASLIEINASDSLEDVKDELHQVLIKMEELQMVISR